MSIEAMKLALEAIEDLRGYRPDIDKAIETLRTALSPQPAQATQAEVTNGIRPEDFTVDVVVKPMGGFAPVNTQGVRVTHNPTGISVTCDAARSQHMNRQQAIEKLSALLALRPEPVAMTGEQRQSAFLSAPTSSGGHRTAFMHGIQFAEAHHGITAKAKKEGA